MNILVLTNLYPPHEIGGYEIPAGTYVMAAISALQRSACAAAKYCAT